MVVSILIENMWFSILLFSIFVYWYFNTRNYRNMLSKIPYSPTIPFFGHFLQLSVDESKLYEMLLFICGTFQRKGLFLLWVLRTPYLLLNRTVTAQPILSSTYFIDKSSKYRFYIPVVGRGILSSNGINWERRHKLIVSVFKKDNIDEFIDIYNRHSKILLKNLSSRIGEKYSDIYPLIDSCVFDIICDSTFGNHSNAQERGDFQYPKIIDTLWSLSQRRITNTILQHDFIFRWTSFGKEYVKCLESFRKFKKQLLYKGIEDWENESLNNENAEQKRKILKKSFLKLFLEESRNNCHLSSEIIEEETDAILAKAYPAIKSATVWTLFLIAGHEDVQNKVYRELHSIFDKDVDKDITMKDLESMVYLNCVIKETLRLFPPIPLILRTIKEDTTLNGYEIPAGMDLIIVNTLVQRDATCFPGPDNFNPERFRPENINNDPNQTPYSFLAFSAGPRKCLGEDFSLMGIKVIIAQILRRYSFVAEKSLFDVDIAINGFTLPRDPINVRISSRSSRPDL